jgi:3-oxoacyl-[acyl-carrier protein] reductase
VCDVRNTEQIEAWFAETASKFGRVSILITNTGGPPAGHVGKMTDSQWQDGFDSTLMNVVRLVRLVAPEMKEQQWGRIVHITSLVAFALNELLPISTTLRAGIRGLTKAQAHELGPSGITVNAVLPGHTMSDRQRHLAKAAHDSTGIEESEYFKRIESEIPVGRIADAEAIAAPIAFLCSQPAWFVNGVSLLVDGGMTKAV